MPKAKNWRQVRAEAITAGRLTEAGLELAKTDHDTRIQAWRLGELRKRQSVTQREVAEGLNVSQSRVSRIENGDIDHAEVSTLRGYVEALGGKLTVVATIGDEQLRLS